MYNIYAYNKYITHTFFIYIHIYTYTYICLPPKQKNSTCSPMQCWIWHSGCILILHNMHLVEQYGTQVETELWQPCNRCETQLKYSTVYRYSWRIISTSVLKYGFQNFQKGKLGHVLKSCVNSSHKHMHINSEVKSQNNPKGRRNQKPQKP